MILLIDNYDSFTYNLCQYLNELGEKVMVVRNNRVSLEEIEAIKPVRIVISPGPSTPEKAGVSNDIVRCFGARIPILGVCLGHQCLGSVYGGRVVRAGTIMHGKSSRIHHRGRGLFRGVPSTFTAIRYHSLVVDIASLPGELEVTAWTEDGTVMGLRHRRYPSAGIQFHPESFMTEYGREILKNFIGGADD